MTTQNDLTQLFKYVLKPEKLKGKSEECTLEQIKECHGDKEHSCCGDEKKKE
jgi:hypothetical protein